MQVDHPYHQNIVRVIAKKHAVWKPANHGASNLPVNEREPHGIFPDVFEEAFDRVDISLAQPLSLILVPIPGFPELILCESNDIQWFH